jgi:hypothetical protein
MTDNEAQALHDLRKKIHGENHDSVSCWCCCLDCDFKTTYIETDGERVTIIAPVTGKEPSQ